jgi:hypothetical protein
MNGPTPGCNFKITSGITRTKCTKPNIIPAIYAHGFLNIVNKIITIKMKIEGYTTYGRV